MRNYKRNTRQKDRKISRRDFVAGAAAMSFALDELKILTIIQEESFCARSSAGQSNGFLIRRSPL